MRLHKSHRYKIWRLHKSHRRKILRLYKQSETHNYVSQHVLSCVRGKNGKNTFRAEVFSALNIFD